MPVKDHRLGQNAALLLAGTLLLTACSSPEPAPPPPPPAATMTAEGTVQWYQDCWSAFNKKDFVELRKCYADNAESRQLGYGAQPVIRGGDSVIDDSRRFAQESPDGMGMPQLVVVNGNKAASITVLHGTNTGPMKGPDGKETPAANKPFGLYFGHAVEIDSANARINKEIGAMDSGTFAGQLGLRPGPVRPVMSGTATPTVVVAKNDEKEKANLAALAQQIEIFNKHDIKGLTDTSTPDLIFHEAAMPKDHNLKESMDAVAKMWKAFPDMKIVPESTWAAGDYVVLIGALEGTNKAAFPDMGIQKATGKTVRLPFFEVDRLENGKFKETWVVYDSVDMARQLGLMP